MRRIVRFVLAVTALGGCASFDRTVVNGYVRDIDTSWIEPGKTTRDEVIDRIGRPPALLGVKGADGSAGRRDGLSRHYLECLTVTPPGIDVAGEDADGPEARAFRWFSVDSFNGKFEGGKWVVPTFGRRRSRRTHDILVLFDEADVVTLVSRTSVVDDKVRVLEWREAAK